MLCRAHILVCAGAACVSSGCREIRDAIVVKVKEYGLQDEVKVIETGCVGSCDLGPLALVYPEGIFYQKLKPEDAEEIVGEHLLKGRIVERLLYKEPDDGKDDPLSQRPFLLQGSGKDRPQELRRHQSPEHRGIYRQGRLRRPRQGAHLHDAATR